MLAGGLCGFRFVHFGWEQRRRSRQSDQGQATLAEVVTAANRSSGLRLDDARVRGVFHPALVAHLEAFGAGSVSEMRRHGFSCFGLPLIEGEIQALVESARRHGLVEPLEHDQTASGSLIREVEWIATERGHRVRPVRTLAPGHLLHSIADIASPARQFFSGWISMASLVVSVVFVEVLEPSPALSRAIVGVSSALVLYFLLGRAITAEYRLRAAVRAWPRLENAHPGQYTWHTASLRFWPGPVTAILFGAGVLMWVLVDRRPAAALFAVGVLFGVVVEGFFLRPLRSASQRPPGA